MSKDNGQKTNSAFLRYQKQRNSRSISMKLKTGLLFLLSTLLIIIAAGAYAQEPGNSQGSISLKKAQAQKSAQSRQKIANEYYRNREYEKAAAMYEELYKEQPSYVNYMYLVYSLVEINEFKKAERYAKKQIRNNPGNLRYVVDLGYIYNAAGEEDKAMDKYKEALSKLTADRNKIHQLANAFESKRESKLAVETYLKGQKMLDGAYSFNYELGGIYYRLGKYKEMINAYLDLIGEDESKISVVQNRLQSVLNNDPDNSIHDLLRKSLLQKIQKEPELALYSEMLLWYSVQEKDFETALSQAIALDKRYQGEGQKVYNIALLSSNNRDYKTAIKAFRYITGIGEDHLLFVQAKTGLLTNMYMQLTSQAQTNEKDLKNIEEELENGLEQLGKNTITISLIRKLAHLKAYYLNDFGGASALLEEAVELPNIAAVEKAECKLELADILLYSSMPWDASLLYSQVEKAFKNDPLGHEAKFRNARLSFYIGEYKWAKAQLDVLKAASSKLIANDAMEMSLLISDNMDSDSGFRALAQYSRASLLLFRHKENEALGILDSLEQSFPSHPILDEVLFKKAEVMMQTARYSEADSLYQVIIDFYSEDILADNALFKRAELYHYHYADKDKAMELYQKLLLDFPGSVFTVEARKRYRGLRGDLPKEDV